MHISYKRYSYCKHKSYIRNIYEQSFPKEERFPFWILQCCSRENNVHLECILCDDIPIGMRFIVEYDGISYLMYFAIQERYRNKGYGKQVLRDLVVRNEHVLLCIERPDDSDIIKHRRKNFYLQNDFYETGRIIEDAGVQYEFLSTNKGYQPTIHTLAQRYHSMSSNPIIRYIIRHTFNADHIHFLDI